MIKLSSILLIAVIASLTAFAGSFRLAWDNTYEPGEVDYFTIYASTNEITAENFATAEIIVQTDESLIVTSTNYVFSIMNIPPGMHHIGITATGTNALTSELSEVIDGSPRPDPVTGLTIEIE